MPFITLVACGYQRKKGIVLIPLSVIPLESFVIRLESFYKLLCLDVIKYVSMC